LLPVVPQSAGINIDGHSRDSTDCFRLPATPADRQPDDSTRIRVSSSRDEDGYDWFPVPVSCRFLSISGNPIGVIDGGGIAAVGRRLESSRHPGCRREIVSLQGDVKSTVCRTLQGLLDIHFYELL